MDIQTIAVVAAGLLLRAFVCDRLRDTAIIAPLASASARLAAGVGDRVENRSGAELPLREVMMKPSD
ncbi:MAG: hypothetical protein QNJ85_15255 [Gammaproteobacteria bacterium]|nr:hypothetical protein [Gammaproteobacteria bacterium]